MNYCFARARYEQLQLWIFICYYCTLCWNWTN